MPNIKDIKFTMRDVIGISFWLASVLSVYFLNAGQINTNKTNSEHNTTHIKELRVNFKDHVDCSSILINSVDKEVAIIKTNLENIKEDVKAINETDDSSPN